MNQNLNHNVTSLVACSIVVLQNILGATIPTASKQMRNIWNDQ